MKLKKGKIDHPVKMVIYGSEGIGKSTLASECPDPLFIDVENGSKELDITRVDEPIKTWEDLMRLLDEVKKDPTICRTLVIDTIDAVEILLNDYVCKLGNVKSIEDFGYGKGYTKLAETAQVLLRKLTELNEVYGLNIVLVAHSMIRKFEKPDESGAFDRYELKLSKKVSPLVKEWCDCLLFVNYETMVITPSNKMEKKKIAGGRRMIYTTHHPAWDAKNRYGLDEKLPLEYKSIKKVFEFDNKKLELDPKEVEQAEENPSVRISSENEVEVRDKEGNILDDTDFTELPKDIPTDLALLMQKDEITEKMIIQAVASKGIIAEFNDMENRASRIDDLDSKFIKERIVDQWDNFKTFVKKFAA